jgi:hypothetical protein
MNNNINNPDEIRPPDPVKRETLIEQFDNFNNMYNNNFDNDIFEDIDDNYNQYDIEFHRVLQLSRDEYEFVAQQNENERHRRIDILSNIKQRLLRVKGFDMDNNKIYEMIISIIEMYETEKINTFGVDKENYIAIFNVTKLVRFDKDEIALLKDIIVQL